jgi:hypothetical protein
MFGAISSVLRAQEHHHRGHFLGGPTRPRCTDTSTNVGTTSHPFAAPPAHVEGVFGQVYGKHVILLTQSGEIFCRPTVKILSRISVGGISMVSGGVCWCLCSGRWLVGPFRTSNKLFYFTRPQLALLKSLLCNDR